MTDQPAARGGGFQRFHFPVPVLLESAARLQQEVRDFIAHELGDDLLSRDLDSWSERSPAFSQKLGARGWLGMTWPKRYGGHERSAVERYIVTEELLAAAAPVGAHWTADRQTGPMLLKYGTDDQRERFLPGIAAGKIYFSIGMSEPDAGSDLASVATTANRTSGGWIVNGQKIWTSGAGSSHFMIALCRTTASDDRHEGLSQLILDLGSRGITINPIGTITDTAHFYEVVLEGVFVPDDMVVGEVGRGWRQVTSELVFERSGPERFLTTFPLLVALVEELGPSPDAHQAVVLGELMSQLWTLRRMSLAIAAELDRGGVPAVEAALVKDLGTRFEGAVVDAARELVSPGARETGSRFETLLQRGILIKPILTLRGGTSEILRNLVARGVGAA